MKLKSYWLKQTDCKNKVILHLFLLLNVSKFMAGYCRYTFLMFFLCLFNLIEVVYLHKRYKSITRSNRLIQWNNNSFLTLAVHLLLCSHHFVLLKMTLSPKPLKILEWPLFGKITSEDPGPVAWGPALASRTAVKRHNLYLLYYCLLNSKSAQQWWKQNFLKGRVGRKQPRDC